MIFIIETEIDFAWAKFYSGTFLNYSYVANRNVPGLQLRRVIIKDIKIEQVNVKRSIDERKWRRKETVKVSMKKRSA